MVNIRLPMRFGMDRYSGVYIFVVFLVVFGTWKPALFLTSGTLHSVASAQAIPAMLGLALLAPLACGAYDLSVGATCNLAAILAAYLQVSHGFGILATTVTCLVTGVVIGLVNGVLVVKLHISSFIATLGMATIVEAVQQIVTGGNQPNPPNSTAWRNLTQTSVAGFPIVVVYLLVIAMVIWWVLEHTPAGRYMFAVGSSTEAARLSGVRTGAWTVAALAGSGALSALAGVFYSSQAGPSLTFGSALLLPAYAAAFLGCTQLKPGRFNVWGTLLAVYVLATGVQGLEFVTSVQWLNDMFSGCTLVLAVAFAVWRQRRVGRSGDRTAAGVRSLPEPRSGEHETPVGEHETLVGEHETPVGESAASAAD
jgi:ribose transport system permease protein